MLSLPDLREKLRISAASISQMAFAPEGDNLALRTTNGLALWSRQANQTLWEVPQSDAGCLAFSSDGRLLFSRNDHRAVIMRRVDDGDFVSHLGVHRAALSSLAVSADGRTLATADREGTIRLSHVPTGRDLFDLHNTGRITYVLGFSADSRSLVAHVGVDPITHQEQIAVFETGSREY